MSARQETLRLRLELLRMRAQIERAEVAAALQDVRGSTHRLRQIAAVASSVRVAASGRTSSWLGLLAGVITQRPWLAAIAVGLLRSARRHPVLALIAIGASVFIWRRQRITEAAPPHSAAGSATAPASTQGNGEIAG